MWLTADYEGVTLFSLRPSATTASGGKTLLVPTPYAIKMALLDAACRLWGVTAAQGQWPAIRDLQVALRLPDKIVVTNLFQRVLRPRRSPAERGEADAGPFQRTIGYREYAQMVGPLGVAVGWSGHEPRDWLGDLLLNVSYLGKRGGFVQLLGPPGPLDDLPLDFLDVTGEQRLFAFDGTLQVLDDCAPGMTFAHASIYSSERITLGKERLTRPIVLPCRLVRSSKSFTVYERLP